MQVEWSESDKGELHGREKIVVTVKEVWGWLQAKWGEGMNEPFLEEGGCCGNEEWGIKLTWGLL